jgi:hypothetical protein
MLNKKATIISCNLELYLNHVHNPEEKTIIMHPKTWQRLGSDKYNIKDKIYIEPCSNKYIIEEKGIYGYMTVQNLMICPIKVSKEVDIDKFIIV